MVMSLTDSFVRLFLVPLLRQDNEIPMEQQVLAAAMASMKKKVLRGEEPSEREFKMWNFAIKMKADKEKIRAIMKANENAHNANTAVAKSNAEIAKSNAEINKNTFHALLKHDLGSDDNTSGDDSTCDDDTSDDSL